VNTLRSRDVTTLRCLVLAALAALLCLPTPGAAASLQELAQRLFPQAVVDSVEPTPIPNIYEVRAGRSIMYMDASGRYVFVGELYDFHSRKNLTAEKLLALNTMQFDDLPLDLAVRLGSANATKRLAVFDDVDCPYCKRFHEETLPRLLKDGVAAYIFLYPITSLHPQAEAKSKIVWCSENRAAALDAALHNTLLLTQEASCSTPLAEIGALAAKLGIKGTPTLILDTGLRLDGFVTYDALMARWQSSARK